MTKFLFIAYHFPPVGGAGVQRTVKFLKYLPEQRFRSVIITGPGASNDRWTPVDQSISGEIPEGIIIYRIKSSLSRTETKLKARLERWLMIPNQFEKWWVRKAIKLGEEACKKENIKLIYTSMSPFESAKIAYHLSKKFCIPWVADLRDPWALDEMRVYPTFYHRMAEKKKMQSLLLTASVIVMNTPEATDCLIKAFPALVNKRVVTITNGFDNDDFKKDFPERNNHKFRIVHSGYLHTDLGFSLQRKRRFYSIVGGTRDGVDILTRSHVFLLGAIKRLLVELPGCADSIELYFVGKSSKGDREYAEKSEISNLIHFTGYLPHRECLKLVRSANLLFLPMHNLPTGIRSTIVPGKTYEYMASGVPILGAVPDGDARDYLKQCGTGLTCRPDDIAGMTSILYKVYNSWKNKKSIVKQNWEFINKYERKYLTQLLAREFDKLIT